MTTDLPTTDANDSRSAHWKWIVCGLLLLASAINYMDRQTLANASVRITKEFGLNQEQYGNIESVFGYAFAVGSLVFGWLADRVSIRWLYAIVLALWSAAGFATGFTHSYDGLLWCRALLGFFEAGHWPCGIRTTRALLSVGERSLGNSVLQSGTSIGAIITPLVMARLMTSELGSWRIAFQVVGVVGLAWILLWLYLMRHANLESGITGGKPDIGDATRRTPIWEVLFSRRMLIVYFMIACINTTWQLLRAWLPKILQEGRGYTEPEALYFNSFWYAATDVGCLGAGALTLWFARGKMSAHSARIAVFTLCGLLSALTVAVPFLDRGWALLVLLSAIGAGALGVFPIYHAFTQEISAEHQGKITGIAGVAGWVIPAQAQKIFGMLADRTGSFDTGLAYAGLLPLLAVIPLWLFWEPRKSTT